MTDKEALKAYEAQQEVMALQSAVRDLQTGWKEDPWQAVAVGLCKNKPHTGVTPPYRALAEARG